MNQWEEGRLSGGVVWARGYGQCHIYIHIHLYTCVPTECTSCVYTVVLHTFRLINIIFCAGLLCYASWNKNIYSIYIYVLVCEMEGVDIQDTSKSSELLSVFRTFQKMR